MTQIRTLRRVAFLALVMLWLPAATQAEEIWQTPGAQLLILPNVSHFAFIPNPAELNAAALEFLAE